MRMMMFKALSNQLRLAAERGGFYSEETDEAIQELSVIVNCLSGLSRRVYLIEHEIGLEKEES